MIRNFLFNIFFFLGIFIISIIFIPALIIPNKVILFGGKMMGYWSEICLRLFLSSKVIVKGRDKIVKKENFFIASSHQSMFETFYLQTIFNSPIFILKSELIRVPIFGWYLKKIGSISVNRNKISKKNLGLIDKIKASIKKTSRPLIIFPQATRVLPSERISFKKGVGRIYKELGIKCQPVAINSGYVWPKKGPLIANKNIIVSILEPIEPGIPSSEFVNVIEKKIYSELDNIG
tara:strand:+ start:296 stop:997 length:702 start_codon:yes stop_codon:yes gene_type:complete